MSSQWQTSDFQGLGNTQLYAALKLRQEVFAVEQASIYVDADGLDLNAIHMLYWEQGELMAYQRCLPPGLQETESTLGRIVVAPAARGRNLGRELVRRGIAHNFERWPHADIRIHAQAHLEAYYCGLGFATQGEVYDLDGIPHLEMLCSKTPA